MKIIKNLVLDLIFPKYCVSCFRPGAWVCASCFSQIDISSLVIKSLPSNHFDRAWGMCEIKDKPLGQIIHNYKYNFVRELEEYLEKIILEYFSQHRFEDFLDADMIIPVPLSRKRQLIRGFNQAEIIANIIAKEITMPVENNLLYRRLNNRPQVGLIADQRQSNVRGIFNIRSKELLRGKNILLVDDVITTGATISECARVIKEAGASKVWGLALAKG